MSWAFFSCDLLQLCQMSGVSEVPKYGKTPQHSRLLSWVFVFRSRVSSFRWTFKVREKHGNVASRIKTCQVQKSTLEISHFHNWKIINKMFAMKNKRRYILIRSLSYFAWLNKTLERSCCFFFIDAIIIRAMPLSWRSVACVPQNHDVSHLFYKKCSVLKILYFFDKVWIKIRKLIENSILSNTHYRKTVPLPRLFICL